MQFISRWARLCLCGRPMDESMDGGVDGVRQFTLNLWARFRRSDKVSISGYFDGQMDELMVQKGAPFYTATFTGPIFGVPGQSLPLKVSIGRLYFETYVHGCMHV